MVEPVLRVRCLKGFSLLELVVVIALLAVVACLALPLLGSVRADAQMDAAKATLSAIRESILGSSDRPGYLADMKCVPGFQEARFRMHDLLDSSSYPSFSSFDPVVERGWRGPYLHNTQSVSNTNESRAGRFPAATERRFADDGTFLERGFFQAASSSVYGSVDDEVAADPWGNPIVIQIPRNDFRYARLVSAGKNGVLETPRDVLTGGSISQRGDDLVLFLNRSDKP